MSGESHAWDLFNSDSSLITAEKEMENRKKSAPSALRESPRVFRSSFDEFVDK